MDINSKKYKIGFISFIKPGILPFSVFLLFILAYIPLLVYTYSTDKQLGAWLVAILWICFMGVPPIVLHLNYFLHDRKENLVVNNVERTITFTESIKEHRIRYDEIERIEKCHSKRSGDGFEPKMPWHTYYYYKIIVKDNEPVYISRMIQDNLEQKMEGICFKNIRVFYPMIKRTRV